MNQKDRAALLKKKAALSKDVVTKSDRELEIEFIENELYFADKKDQEVKQEQLDKFIDQSGHFKTKGGKLEVTIKLQPKDGDVTTFKFDLSDKAEGQGRLADPTIKTRRNAIDWIKSVVEQVTRDEWTHLRNVYRDVAPRAEAAAAAEAKAAEAVVKDAKPATDKKAKPKPDKAKA